MSTLGEIIQNVKNLVSTNQSNAILTTWINKAQWDIFRELSQTTVDVIDTYAGQSLYTPPTGCLIELIDSVVIVSTDSTGAKITSRYVYKNLHETVEGNFYYRIGNLMGIYPIPTESGDEITITFKKRPAALSENNLDGVPELSEDYHDMLELAAIIKIYKAREDIEMANNYTLEYNQRLLDLKSDAVTSDPEYSKTQDVLPGPNRGLRNRQVKEVDEL